MRLGDGTKERTISIVNKKTVERLFFVCLHIIDFCVYLLYYISRFSLMGKFLNWEVVVAKKMMFDVRDRKYHRSNKMVAILEVIVTIAMLFSLYKIVH